MINISVKDCYELEGDFQNQFLGNEVFPEPKYNKLKLAERTVNKVHYEDVYILEPLHYYYVTFNEEFPRGIIPEFILKAPLSLNGLISFFEVDRLFIFNASQNFVFLQKNTKIALAVV